MPTRVEAFVLSEEQQVIHVAAGDAHSLALTKEGRVYSWGSASYGRLGLGSDNDMYKPKLIDALKVSGRAPRGSAGAHLRADGGQNIEVTHISCNTFHSLAVVDPSSSQMSSLYTWGGGQYGKLGIGSTDNQPLPVEVPFFRKKVRARSLCREQHPRLG